MHSKKIKILKLNYLNQWKYNILKINFQISQYSSNSSQTFLRLYEDYKYKESYLETLKIIYQLKESENYSFQPNTNKIFNSQYNSKYVNDDNNFLTRYSPKNKDLFSYTHFDKKNDFELNTNQYPLKSYNTTFFFSKYENNSSNKKNNKKQKIKLSKPINYFNISIHHNKIYKRKNSFSNTIYLSNLQLSPYNQSSKISLPDSKNKISKNIRSKRNNLIYPNQLKKNKTEIIIRKSTKNKKISHKLMSNTLETTNSFISDNIIKKPISNKSKRNKSIKIPNFNYFFTDNNDKNIFSPKSPYYIYDNVNLNLSDSNENSLTKKNSKDTKTAENSKLKSPDSFSLSLSKNKKLKNYKSLNINLEDPLYEISSNDNNNYSSNSNNINNHFPGISHNYINVKGIKKKETNSIISLQSISDEKLFNQAKLYLTKDNSLENFIRTNKTKKRNFKKEKKNELK